MPEPIKPKKKRKKINILLNRVGKITTNIKSKFRTGRIFKTINSTMFDICNGEKTDLHRGRRYEGVQK